MSNLVSLHQLFSYLLTAKTVWYFICQKLIKPMTSYGKQLTELSVEIYIMDIANKTNDLEK